MSPTKKLVDHTGRPIAASDLKVGEEGHFKKFNATQEHKEWITNAIRDLFDHTSHFERQLMRPIALCMGNILVKVATLMGRDSDITVPVITSEAELRFAVADSIIEMLCNSWGYQVTK